MSRQLMFTKAVNLSQSTSQRRLIGFCRIQFWTKLPKQTNCQQNRPMKSRLTILSKRWKLYETKKLSWKIRSLCRTTKQLSADSNLTCHQLWTKSMLMQRSTKSGIYRLTRPAWPTIRSSAWKANHRWFRIRKIRNKCSINRMALPVQGKIPKQLTLSSISAWLWMTGSKRRSQIEAVTTIRRKTVFKSAWVRLILSAGTCSTQWLNTVKTLWQQIISRQQLQLICVHLSLLTTRDALKSPISVKTRAKMTKA